ncbi:MAG TPA: hypothetical protein VMJ66_15345 [Geobacteraceae bacterium]|nr:hypothetical protein [Geobacteraceae bacterium]
MKKCLVVFFFLLLSSCVYQRYPGIADPSIRINNVSGVSVLPPQEQGWLIPQMSLYQLTFIKQGVKQDSTYVAQVVLFKLASFESEQSFLQYVSQGRAAGPDTGRFETLKNKEEIFRGREVICVKYGSVSVDKASKTQSAVRTMIMETTGYCCQHPKNKNIGVDFGYSYRHYPGDEDADFEKKAHEFLEQIRFTDF